MLVCKKECEDKYLPNVIILRILLMIYVLFQYFI